MPIASAITLGGVILRLSNLPLEALQGYTLYGVWLAFEADRKGSIEPGKLADMIVLDQDIFSIDPERILDMEVAQIWHQWKTGLCSRLIRRN